MPGARNAAFAASGTCLRAENGAISIVTGGKCARKLLFLEDKWKSWDLLVKQINDLALFLIDLPAAAAQTEPASPAPPTPPPRA